MHPISIVIPTLNEEKYLPALLESLAMQKECEMDVIIVDGRSDDQTQAVAEHFIKNSTNPYLKARMLLANKRNISFQRNMGGYAAAHPLIFFVDADCAFPNGHSLVEIIEAFKKQKLDAAAGRVRSLEHYWLTNFYFYLFYLFIRIMQWFKPFAAGGFIMAKKNIFETLHGFDETIPLNEDGDFCRRAKLIGRFRILKKWIYASGRRFEKQGYLKSGIMYLRIGAHRILKGEIHNPGQFDYQFGKFGESKKQENKSQSSGC